MKTLTGILAAFAIVVCGFSAAQAQSSSKQKRAAAIEKMVNDGSYIFEANTANPETGGSRQLTSEYDLKVTGDSLIAFLPYFGRAYMAPNDPTTNEGGIKFTTTNFSYAKTVKKNGNWEISIKPKDTNIIDWRDVQRLILYISKDGYATLQVSSTNRDPISFDGYIKSAKM